MRDAPAHDMMQAAKPLHRLLQTQAEQYLPADWLQEPVLQQFMHRISLSYKGFERDRALSEHAYQVSEQEYQGLNEQLRQQSKQSEAYVGMVRQALATLRDEVAQPAPSSEEGLDLHALLQHLQVRIGLTKKLEQDLLQAKLLAEDAARAKSEFLSVMSHEIRTPLNAVIGLTNLINTDPNPANQAEYIGLLTKSCENLLGLVNDILDFSKLEEHRIELQTRPFNLRQIISTLMQAHQPAAQAKGLYLRQIFDECLPQLVLGDDYRLQQILNNLLSNAVKFTASGGVMLEVHATECPEGKARSIVVFAVRDTGIGMSEAEQRLVFERFGQASADTSRLYGGSGLGLSIVRELVELHGGTIHLESTPGAGSTFTFTLSLPEAQPSMRAVTPVLSGQNLPRIDGLRLLLAEDLPLNIMVARRLLERQGAKVDVAENGHQALALAQQHDYDLILMDLQMPLMDGFEAMQAIRAVGIETPALAFSADASPHARTQARAVGIAGFVPKPFNPEHLLQEILHWVGK